MTENTNKKQNKCKNCGGNLVFSPATQNLFCEKCLTYKQIKHSLQVEKHNLNKALKSNEKTTNETDRFVNCPNCGNKINLDKFEISKDCTYCGSSIVAQDVSIISKKPDGIIPFAFDKKQASEKFVENVKKQFWAPRKFKKQPPERVIEGDYIPSFAFNTDVVYTYKGMLYNERTVEHRNGHSDTVRDYFKIAGEDSTHYDNILVESSSKISQHNINGILPYDYSKVYKYQDAYISGFVVEKYDKSVSNCLKTYDNLLTERLRRDILSQYSYDGVDYLHIKKTTYDETYSYNIVPLYKFTYSYKKKQFVTYMNGQTGRIDKNIPKSGWKIFFIIVLPIILITCGIIFGSN